MICMHVVYRYKGKDSLVNRYVYIYELCIYVRDKSRFLKDMYIYGIYIYIYIYGRHTKKWYVYVYA